MEKDNVFLKDDELLIDYYNQKYNEISQSGKTANVFIEKFAKEVLMEPSGWFEALAVGEYAIETKSDIRQTEDFFLTIFKSYDMNAAFDLNNTDYEWYWQKIQNIFDKLAELSPVGLLEKGLQYLFARHDYTDPKKSLDCLEEAVAQGLEVANVLCGYYLYKGLFGDADKEKGLKLVENVTTPKGKTLSLIYKGYIAVDEGQAKNLISLLDLLDKEPVDASMKYMVDELHGYALDLEGKYDEAVSYYQKAIEVFPSNLSLYRLGFLIYNEDLKSFEKDEDRGLEYMMEAFRFGRVDVADSLYTNGYGSYFGSGRGSAIYNLEKGCEYGNGQCCYQLGKMYLTDILHYKPLLAAKFLDKGIALKNTDCMVMKALYYCDGRLWGKNDPVAFKLLTEAIALGSGLAAQRLGLMYDEGRLSPMGVPDKETAVKWYIKSAEMGDKTGYEYAGRHHYLGWGCEQSYQKAYDYYQKGYDIGSSYCAVELAMMYEEGIGVEKDMTKMMECLRMSEENNYTHGIYLLGRCYRYGIGVEVDPKKAFKYFERASHTNHEKAITELALCYEEGAGVEVNPIRSMKYMRQAAKLGHAYAQYKIGHYFMYGVNGAEVNYSRSLKWLHKAAKNGEPFAYLQLGDYYMYNFGEENKQHKAFAFYQKALELDCVNEGIGTCYLVGYGVEEDAELGINYLKKAAEGGFSRAMFTLGQVYYNGKGVDVDYMEAYRWFSKASLLDNLPARHMQGNMLIAGEGCIKNVEEGLALLRNAAEEGDDRSAFDLGTYYREGQYVEQDEEQALNWFRLAADNGNQEALSILGKRHRSRRRKKE